MLTTGNVAVLKASGLKLGGASCEAARLDRDGLEEGGALGGFSPDVVARVSRDEASQTNEADGNSGCEVNHD